MVQIQPPQPRNYLGPSESLALFICRMSPKSRAVIFLATPAKPARLGGRRSLVQIQPPQPRNHSGPGGSLALFCYCTNSPARPGCRLSCESRKTCETRRPEVVACLAQAGFKSNPRNQFIIPRAKRPAWPFSFAAQIRPQRRAVVLPASPARSAGLGTGGRCLPAAGRVQIQPPHPIYYSECQAIHLTLFLLIARRSFAHSAPS